MSDANGPGDAVPAVAPGTTLREIAELIECWWADQFPGSPVAQVTAAWNHAFAAKEELKRRLVNLAEGVL